MGGTVVMEGGEEDMAGGDEYQMMPPFCWFDENNSFKIQLSLWLIKLANKFNK